MAAPHRLAASISERTPEPLKRSKLEAAEPESAALDLYEVDGHADACRGCRADASEQTEAVPVEKETKGN